jgi:hypothetical protein
MALTIFHDPLHDLMAVFERLYPTHSAEIVFGGEVPEDGCGVTIFGDGDPQIVISADLPYLNCAEILAHELAHVVAGHGADHGEEWETVFDALHAGYMAAVEARSSGTVKSHLETSIGPIATTQPRLTVRLRSFPESNGKRNWTALLVRVDAWGGLIGNCGGITIDRGELWNRVAYEAECARLLIGERDTEPHILDYGDDITTPDQWAGEVRGGRQLPAQGPW